MAILSVVALTLITGFVGSFATPSFYLQTVALLAVGTVGLYYYLTKVRKSRPGIFVQACIATIVLKLLVYGGYVLVMFRLDPKGAIPNAVSFAVLYLIFTGLEVFFVYRKVTG